MGGGGDNVYTLAQASQHNSLKDCWLIINGKVYDVTKFLEDHPGGDEVLLSATGKDATDDFKDVGHSSAARAMLDEWTHQPSPPRLGILLPSSLTMTMISPQSL